MLLPLAAVLLGLLLTVATSADSLDIQAAKDNTIYEEDSTLSNGAGDHIFAGNNKDGDARRALLAFDVAAAIPAGSTIDGVSLTLALTRAQQAGSFSISLHRAQADWGEAGSHAPDEEGKGDSAQTGDATWMHREYDTLAWASLGGDLDGSASASTIVGDTIQDYTWSSAAMAADVQAWLDSPATNFGWFLVGDESQLRSARRFASKDIDIASARPILHVEFTPPAATVTPTATATATPTATATATPTATASATPTVTPTGPPPTATPSPTGPPPTATPTPSPTTTPTATATATPSPTTTPTTTPVTGACCLTAGCQELTEAQCTAQSGTYQGDGTTCADVLCPLEPYVDPLPLPAVANPVSGASGDVATYEIPMVEFQQHLHRDLPTTTLWGYAGLYPGPTIEAFRDKPVTVTWINDLREGGAGGPLRTEHILPVDLCPHGPDTEGNNPRTVVHLHGGHVPMEADGYPEFTFLPGEQDTYVYPNNQLASTLWYHDHALGITRLNVYMGLAGFYILRDEVENALGLPDDLYEIPLAIQDRSFAADGSLVYPADWQEHFFADYNLVNGKVFPYLEVDQGLYRFRVLNGSNARTYALSLSNGASFQVIGMEGGLLPAPVTKTQVTLGPAERADIIMDFSGETAGTEILLQNSAGAPFPFAAGEKVMKFVVTAATGHTTPIPGALRPLETLDEADASLTRDLELFKQTGAEPCPGSLWTINGLHWDDVTELPELGDTEVWSFINLSGIMHPMHIHLVMFQVLDRQPVMMLGEAPVPLGVAEAPPPEEAGWKDTVQVPPDTITRVIARFDDYTGLFPYHCHILEHEDHEMMRQFEVTAPPALDVDGNDDPDALTDGLLILRWLFGFRGSVLTGGAVGGGCTRCDATAIEGWIMDHLAYYDADGNGTPAALIDGLLILRYLFGFRGDSLVSGAVALDDCTRCTAAAIEAYLPGLMP